jgi:hypothetical protein
MAKVAKLVMVSLMTRVVVDENDTEEQIIEASRLKFLSKIENELGEHIELIENDEEVPFGEVYDDVYYRPKIDDRGGVINHEYSKHGVLSCEVWRDKSNLKKLFPKCIVEEFSGDDIENKVFVD